MTDLLPAVLLNTYRQYKFDGSPLWRMADRKDHVKIEVTFCKITHQRFDKKRAKSGLTSSHQLDNLQDRCQLTLQCRIWWGRHHHHRRRHYNINWRPSHYHATRIQWPSLHHLRSTDQHRRRVQMLRRRRNQGLLHRPETSPNHQPDTTTARSRSRIRSIKVQLAWGSRLRRSWGSTLTSSRHPG